LKEKNPNLKSISLIGFFIFLSFFVAQKLYGAEDEGKNKSQKRFAG